MQESLILEALNGAFFILALCASFVFTHYLWVKRTLGYRALGPAIGLTCVWYGEMLLRGLFWYVRDQINGGNPMMAPAWGIILGSSIITIGILCCIRVFSPENWGNKSWSISLLLAAAFVVWTVYS